MAAIVSGSIDLSIHNVDDHHSLMELFRKAVVSQWLKGKEPEREFWDMIQEYRDECPAEFDYDVIRGQSDG